MEANSSPFSDWIDFSNLPVAVFTYIIPGINFVLCFWWDFQKITRVYNSRYKKLRDVYYFQNVFPKSSYLFLFRFCCKNSAESHWQKWSLAFEACGLSPTFLLEIFPVKTIYTFLLSFFDLLISFFGFLVIVFLNLPFFIHKHCIFLSYGIHIAVNSRPAEDNFNFERLCLVGVE